MASKSLGVLTLDLVARTGNFVAGMDKAERQTKKWQKEVTVSAIAVGNALGDLGADAVRSLSRMAWNALTAGSEIHNLAKLAGASTTEFQKFAAGARTVGIENDKLADILKDVNDKVGDFLVTGGGELKEFFESVAPKVGVTAEQFRNLSGPQALGLYVDTLEKAGANQQEMTFFLEAIANDATLLAPLLRNGAKEMRGLADEAQNLGLILSEETIAGAKQFNDDLDLLGRVAGGVGQQIAAELLPDLLELTNTLRDPQTAKAAADMAKAVVGSFTTIIDGARNTVQFIQWAAESAAAFMGGIAADDLVRLNDEIERLEQMKASGALDRLVFFGRDGIASYYNDEELDAELAKLRAAAEAAMQGSGPLVVPVEPKLLTSEPSPGPGLNLSRSSTPRSDSSSKAAAVAAREAEKALRAQQAALDAVNDAQERNNQEAIAILDSLMSEEEQIKQSYERRRQIIMDATLLTEQDKNEAILALQQEHDEAMMEVNGSYWERYLAAAEENLQSFDELSGVMLENFTGRFGDAFESMVFDAESLGDAVQGLAEGMARSIVNALGQMAAQWVAYQAVQMLVGKTTQASAANTLTFNALASQQMAAINAFASTAAIPIVGPLMAPAASAAAIAATSPMVGAVASLSLAGMAHEGIDSIPQTGTWLLEKGERVTTAETSAKLDKTLSDIEQGGSGAPIVNLYEDSAKAGQVNSRQEDGKNVIDIFVADIMSDGKSSKAISRAFGVQRSGT